LLRGSLSLGLDTANNSVGIGRQVAISFAAEGCLKIAICDKNESGLVETRSLIQDSHSKVQVEVFVLDVSDEQSVVAMTAGVVDKLGSIDYAVNSAGLFVQLSSTVTHFPRPAESQLQIYGDIYRNLRSRYLGECPRLVALFPKSAVADAKTGSAAYS
jgi:NAD(P)-dependent dehydrogenase (short-subunit alcohol dehydrogenase family)